MYVQNSLITLLHTSSNDHIVIALAYLHSHGYSVQVMWPPRAAKCNGLQNKYFDEQN